MKAYHRSISQPFFLLLIGEKVSAFAVIPPIKVALHLAVPSELEYIMDEHLNFILKLFKIYFLLIKL